MSQIGVLKSNCVYFA